jgi:hypothetical protein
MFARYIERKPFGEKEELKELKIWMAKIWMESKNQKIKSKD